MADERDDEREIIRICERIGYGRVMQAASDAWRKIDPIGALTIGPCAGLLKTEADERDDAEALIKTLDDAIAHALMWTPHATQADSNKAMLRWRNALDALRGRLAEAEGLRVSVETARIALNVASDSLQTERAKRVAAEAKLEQLEQWNRDMVAKAASGGALDGYRALGAKLAETEARAEAAEAKVAELEAWKSAAMRGLVQQTDNTNREYHRANAAEAKNARLREATIEECAVVVDKWAIAVEQKAPESPTILQARMHAMQIRALKGAPDAQG